MIRWTDFIISLAYPINFGICIESHRKTDHYRIDTVGQISEFITENTLVGHKRGQSHGTVCQTLQSAARYGRSPDAVYL
uniref:Uncharacterized protein n=1 Tax=Romanomermis culicivorax TaxID=13658 RepID=A0A915J7J4_ROMCU